MENKVEMVILRGLPASGKSTMAREWVKKDPEMRIRVNRDDLRYALYEKYWALTNQQEEMVTHLQVSMVQTALDNNKSVIIDDTNLRAKTVRHWYDVADRYKVEAKVVDVDTPVEECIARDSVREKKVGESVIRMFHDRFYSKGKMPAVPERLDTAPKGWIPYVPDETLPKAFMFDIDGTLARMKDRSPFDWSRVGEDEVVHDVVDVLNALHENGYHIVVMSGRDSSCMTETADWLEQHGIMYDDLYMRPAGSYTPDDKVKHELFNQHVRNNYRVHGVFDDRLKVCRMWEEIGLTLFRVGPIDADF